MAWLEENLKTIREGSAYSKDEVSLRWEQGAMQVLSEFCLKARSARQLQYAKRK